MKKERYFSAFEIGFIIIALIVASVCKFILDSSWLAYVSMLSGLAGGILNMKGNKFSYIFAGVSALLYIFVSYQAQNYGEAILNLVYLAPLNVYSVIRWTFSGAKPSQGLKETFSISRKTFIILFAAIAVFVPLYMLVLRKLGSSYPLLNSMCTASCAAACYLGSRRSRQQWYFYLANNLCMILLWSLSTSKDPSGYAILSQNALFMVSNIKGLYNWSKEKPAL